MRAEFLGMVSHELRALLAAIKASAAPALGASRRLYAAEVREFLRMEPKTPVNIGASRLCLMDGPQSRPKSRRTDGNGRQWTNLVDSPS